MPRPGFFFISHKPLPFTRKVITWNGIIHFLVTFDKTNGGNKRFGTLSSREVLVLAPFHIDMIASFITKKIILFIRYMVLKTTGLSSRLQQKNRFWKIRTGSRDIKLNVPKSGLPNQTCIFLDVLANISGPVAYFSTPIFALKPWAQAGHFEYYKP